MYEDGGNTKCTKTAGMKGKSTREGHWEKTESR